MRVEEAKQLALGYAWGREDASGEKTAGPRESYDFMLSFVRGWEVYNAGNRGFMIPPKDAYETWQATDGTTIFKEEKKP